MNSGPERRRFYKALFCASILLLSILALSAPLYAGSTVTSRITLLRNGEYSEALLKGIRNSRSSIICACYLFKTGNGRNSQPRHIAEELIRAVARGVSVTVILEKSAHDADQLNNDNRQTASFLESGGVKVRFDSPEITSHSKVVVIDDRYIFLGSHNLTQAALRYNNEMSVLIESPVMASEVLSGLLSE